MPAPSVIARPQLPTLTLPASGEGTIRHSPMPVGGAIRPSLTCGGGWEGEEMAKAFPALALPACGEGTSTPPPPVGEAGRGECRGPGDSRRRSSPVRPGNMTRNLKLAT